MTGLYVIAARERDWETLGFGDTEAWRQHILGYTGAHHKTARLEIVGALTEIGMSQREIAAATGRSTGTSAMMSATLCSTLSTRTAKPRRSRRPVPGSRRPGIVRRHAGPLSWRGWIPAVVPPVPEPPVVMPAPGAGHRAAAAVAGHVG